MSPRDLDDVFGIQELYRPQNVPPDVDIVAIHGLVGDAIKTWSFEPGNICWLNHPDFLPKYIKNARVLSWGYNANISTFGGKKTSSNRILGHAQTLVSQLQADRELEAANNRPIIFICHSLGGIIVKQALIYAASRDTAKLDHLHAIYTSTYSIMFFGTPHNGTSKANLLGTLQKVASLTLPKGMIQFESNLVRALDKNSETLQSIIDQFSPLMPNFHVFFFWEQDKTDLKYGRDYIVNESSAAPIIDNTERSAIAADHRGMCRFKSNTSPGFRTTVAALRRYCQEAPQFIKARHAMVTTRLNQNRWYEAVETISAIETVTGNSKTWNAAKMHRIQQLGSQGSTSITDTMTERSVPLECQGQDERLQLQNTIAGNFDGWRTEKTPKYPGIQTADGTDSVRMTARHSEARHSEGLEATSKLRPREASAFPSTLNNFLPRPAEEPAYLSRQGSRYPELWLQTEYSSMRRTTEPHGIAWSIFLCFSLGMLTGCLAYFFLERFQYSRRWERVLAEI